MRGRRAPRTLPGSALVLLCLLSLGTAVGCTGDANEKPRLSDADLPRFTGESEFETQEELLRAIREGTFTRRAGLEERIQEVTAQPPPEPVRIDFVVGTDVPEQETAKIHELVQQLADRDGIVVDVVGCSDPSGSEALNRRISQQRAESVAWALEQFELPADRIGAVEGRGESCEVQERAVFLTPRERAADGERASS